MSGFARCARRILTYDDLSLKTFAFSQERAAAAGFDAQRPARRHDARRRSGTNRRDRRRRHESGADDRRHPTEGGAHRRRRWRVHFGRQRGHAAEFRHALRQVHAVVDQEVPHLRAGNVPVKVPDVSGRDRVSQHKPENNNTVSRFKRRFTGLIHSCRLSSNVDTRSKLNAFYVYFKREQIFLSFHCTKHTVLKTHSSFAFWKNKNMFTTGFNTGVHVFSFVCTISTNFRSCISSCRKHIQ